MKPLAIVGGVYDEVVIAVGHQELLGSAGRAAAAIGPQRAQINVHTALRAVDFRRVRAMAANYGYSVEVTESAQTLMFQYVHGLDAPQIYPPLQVLEKASVSVKASNVLCFGALDFEWKVSADRAVYDPQDAFGARSFGERGGSAKRLAVVLNGYEARQITGLASPQEQIAALFEKDDAEVVVLKGGAEGAMVASRGSAVSAVPPFATQGVFKVGSGDVFSAVFAWAWMIEERSPEEAAAMASAATAYYVSTRTLPIPLDFESENEALGIRPFSSRVRDGGSVYLAAPFFTLGERWLVEEARRCLTECGLSVFSPLHDVGFGSAEEVVPKDIAAIKACDAVFAVVSGLDPGTLYEIGYARALNKPVVVFVENEKHEDTKMLKGDGCVLVSDFASSIYAAAWAVRGRK